MVVIGGLRDCTCVGSNKPPGAADRREHRGEARLGGRLRQVAVGLFPKDRVKITRTYFVFLVKRCGRA